MLSFREFLNESLNLTIKKFGEDGIVIYDSKIDTSVQLYCHNYLKYISKGRFSEVGVYISTSDSREKQLAKELEKGEIYTFIIKKIKKVYDTNKSLFEKYKITLVKDSSPISFYIKGETTIMSEDIKEFENIFKTFYTEIENYFQKIVK